MVRRFWRSKVSRFDFLNKFCKTFNLRFQTREQFRVFDFAGSIKQIIDLRHENAHGKKMRVAITENGLKLFDRSQRAPNARRETCETNRFLFKTFGKFEHIDKILQYARHAAVVFWRDNVKSVGF